MADRQDQDLVVTPGQFCYLLDQTKGNIDALVGPFKTSLSATDAAVRWNNTTKTFDVCSQSEAKSCFATASEEDYIVLENPSSNNSHPAKGTRTATVDLSMGHKIVIPGPCSFALYPGQVCFTFSGHILRSNQYLLARVYNDIEAIKYWTSSIVKTPEGTEATLETPHLHMGQLLIIKGTNASFYIPPTGIEILADENGDFIRNAETLERLEFCVLLNESGDKRYVVGPAVVFPEPTETFVQQGASRKGRALELNPISGVYVKVIAEYTENGHIYTPGEELFITGKESSIYYPRPEHSLIAYNNQIIHYAVAIPGGEGRYVLNRMTGDVRIEHGPSMFLPDPRTEVVVRRILSDSEVVLLYPGNNEALDHNRMLRQSSQVNAQDVPMASMTLSEDIDTTFRSARRGTTASMPTAAGSRSTLRGSSGMMSSPGASASISNVSYAATISSAESAAEALVGGAVLQRKTTNTPPRTITLDTKYDGVVGVDVWTGYAALFVRKNGDRRVVVGPKTVLLEYDERPIAFELSTGTPKTDTKKLKTGFLRVINNSVSDRVTVETLDAFQADITLRYHLNFTVQDDVFTDESPTIWFNTENYVQFLAERTRSMIRREAKRHTVRYLRDNAIDIVRDLILGKSVEESERPGRTFDENGMYIFDLDVETPIIQGDVDKALRQKEHETLRMSLELDQQEKVLIHETRLGEIKRKLAEVDAETKALTNQLALADLSRVLSESLARVSNEERIQEVRLERRSDQQSHLDFISTSELARERAEHALELSTERSHAETSVYEIQSRATAITPQLTEVLQRLGDEAVLEKIAASMAPLSILGGGSVLDILKGLLGEGNPTTATLANLVAGFAAGKVS